MFTRGLSALGGEAVSFHSSFAVQLRLLFIARKQREGRSLFWEKKTRRQDDVSWEAHLGKRQFAAVSKSAPVPFR